MESWRCSARQCARRPCAAHLFRLFWRAANSLGFARSDFPSLYAHYDRMMAREAVKKTICTEEAIGYHLPDLKTAGSIKQDR
jgi:glutathione S-transferase